MRRLGVSFHAASTGDAEQGLNRRFTPVAVVAAVFVQGPAAAALPRLDAKTPGALVLPEWIGDRGPEPHSRLRRGGLVSVALAGGPFRAENEGPVARRRRSSLVP